MPTYRFTFFGTSDFSTQVLERLAEHGIIPSLVVTTPPTITGRKHVLTPNEVAVWADAKSIPTLLYKSLKDPKVAEEIAQHNATDFFLVASYGKLIPQHILDIPQHGNLNIHPSLLPRLRGPSPIQTSILTEDSTGVSIMLLDQEMDHGPIVDQQNIDIAWPPYEAELSALCAKTGADMMRAILAKGLDNMHSVDQDHSTATYCYKIKTEDGLLDMQDPAVKNLRKIRAFHRSPGAYFFDERNGKTIRVRVTRASIQNDALLLETVIPEGKREMTYAEYERGRRPLA